MPPRRPRNRGRVSDDGHGLPGGRGTHDADEGETPEARVQSAFSREATKAHTCPLRLRAHGAHRVARGRSGAPSRSRRFASHTRPLGLLDLLLADRGPPVQSFEGGADHDATDGATSGYGGKTWRFSGRTGGCPKLTAEGASHADEISRRTKMKPGTAAPGVSRQTGPSTLLCDGFGVRAAAAAADRSRPEGLVAGAPGRITSFEYPSFHSSRMVDTGRWPRPRSRSASEIGRVPTGTCSCGWCSCSRRGSPSASPSRFSGGSRLSRTPLASMTPRRVDLWAIGPRALRPDDRRSRRAGTKSHGDATPLRLVRACLE